MARAVPGAVAVVPGATTRGSGGRRWQKRRRCRHRLKGYDTAAATSVATDSHGRSTGAAQTASDFTYVAAGTEARHGGLTNATGMVEPDPLTLTWYSSATQDRDISEDPMVEEFAASLVGS